MKEIVKLGIVLFVVCLIAGVALSSVNGITEPVIIQQRLVKDELARKEVLPNAESFEKVAEGYESTITLNSGVVVPVVEVYRGLAEGKTIGFVIKTTPGGYGGGVEVVTGLAVDGVISGVRVGTHQETPGLGAKSTLPEYYKQYDGKMAATVAVNKTSASDIEVQAIAGATITSKAVTAGVNASASVAESLSE